MLVDQFTKWVECYALPNQTAESIVEKIVNEFIARFGCPLYLHSDQGKNVDGKLVRAICDLLEITKTRTTPYRPCANGQVERYNRLLLQMIRCCIQGSNKNWDKYLPQLAAAIRAMPNRSTGFSANLMMFGREVFGPRDLVFRLFDPETEQNQPEYVKQLQEILTKVHQVARDHLKVAQDRQKKTYDLKLCSRSYEVGDIVYKLESACKPGQSRKLNKVWSGPYLVIKALSPVLFKIKGRRKEWVTHHDRLKPCKDRSIPFWMRRMRHSLLNLESSDTGEMTENEDSFLEDVFRDLFDETNDDGDEDHADQDLTFHSAVVISSTPVSQKDFADKSASDVSLEVSTLMSKPSTSKAQSALSKQASEMKSSTRTRKGRKVVAPAHLKDFV